MSGLPVELALLLLVGAVLLVRHLYRRWLESPAQTQTRAAAAARARLESSAPSTAPAAGRAVAQPRTSTQGAARRMDSRVPRPPRRYARAALVPDRRALQAAIVIAAILQPCHAQRGRDSDPA